MLGEIFYNILEGIGLGFILGVNFNYVLYPVLFLVVVLLFYYFMWRKLDYYSQLMNARVMELWEKEEYEISKDNVSSDVKKIRLERLKSDYDEKIKEIRKKRDRIFRFVPFMKRIYKRKKGADAPMFSLP